MIRSLKGMEDILPGDSSKWQALEKFLRFQMTLFGFEEIRTPYLESTSLFSRSIGDQTDVVEKEMYTFTDKNGDSLTLRPENTASVIRAYVEHSLHAQNPIFKCFYIGAMFRHERPQKGRLRQFHQLGAEFIGSTNPVADVESISLLYKIAKDLGIENLAMHINNVGDATCRPRYREALQSFLRTRIADLDETSKNRIEQNPMRIFDSKVETTQAVLREAPLITEYLSPECAQHFERVQTGLRSCGIPFHVNPRIVRGLDYYTNTVFELVAESGLGSQNVVGGGGRYDNLIKELGGPKTPAVGFALGMERLLLVAKNLPAEQIKKIVFIALDGTSEQKALVLQNELRNATSPVRPAGIELLIDKASIKSGLRYADKVGADFALILGESELREQKVQCKDLKNHTSKDIGFGELTTWMKEQL